MKDYAKAVGELGAAANSDIDQGSVKRFASVESMINTLRQQGIIFVASDNGDWEGMYVNGVLKIEGHSLDAQQVIKGLGLTYTFRAVDMADGSNLPRNFSDVPEQE